MILCLLPMVSVNYLLYPLRVLGDWPSRLHQSPVSQVFLGSGQAFMATVAAQENKSPAILRSAQQFPT